MKLMVGNPFCNTDTLSGTVPFFFSRPYVDNANFDLLFDLAQPKQNITTLMRSEEYFSSKELTLVLSKQFKKVSPGEGRLELRLQALLLITFSI